MVTASVALCSFNGERYIRQQLQSILTQSRLPDEIIISDDGSTDRTRDEARQILKTSPHASRIRVRHLEGPREGVTANFSAAIAACTSDVVVLSDQDDVWHTDRLALTVSRFEADELLLLHHTDALLIDHRGLSTGRTLFESLGVGEAEVESVNRGNGFDVYLRRNIATGAVMAFRRHLFDICAPLPSEWIHDEWFAIMASVSGKILITTDTPVQYRQHGANQIGVAAPTLAYRLRRLFTTPPERNERLAVRSNILAVRLDRMREVSTCVKQMASAKAAFETVRASLPSKRLARTRAIARLAVTGGYGRYASQSYLDILRDFVRSIPDVKL